MTARNPRGSAGFTLVEMMIALSITFALALGMLTLLGNTRRTDVAQTALEVLQDDQRLGLGRIIDTVQNAGYFAINASTLQSTPPSITSALAASTAQSGPPAVPAMAAGQYITGVDNGTSTPDLLVVRYLAVSGDGQLDCAGNVSAAASPGAVMVNIFSVDSSSNLDCTVYSMSSTGTMTAGKTVPLAGNVANFQVLYGVCNTCTSGVPSVNAYVTASNVTNWSAVYSVRVQLVFNNPLAGQPGQNPTMPALTQVIPILNEL